MTNEYYNTIKLIATKKIIDEIVKSNLSFNYFFPAPENAPIEWYVENWGTDKEAYNTNIIIDDNILYINCITINGAPINFFKKLVEKYPELYVVNKYSVSLHNTEYGLITLFMNNNELNEKKFIW
jgi:hypothetical protein